VRFAIRAISISFSLLSSSFSAIYPRYKIMQHFQQFVNLLILLVDALPLCRYTVLEIAHFLVAGIPSSIK